MKPRRITYVLDIFPKLSETFIAEELAELRRRRVELCLLSLRSPRDELRHEIIQRAGLDKSVEYDAAKFADVVKKFRPEILHAHFAKDATAKARELSAQFSVPFTFTAHGYDIHRKAPPDFRVRAAAASAVVTVSAANADYISKTYLVPRQHIRVIPCGVDTERFSPERDRSPVAAGPPGNRSPNPKSSGTFAPAAGRDGPRSEPLIVCVTRQVAVKNLGLLLEACARLRDRGVRFRCAMIGDGPLHAELVAKRASLKLEELVEMPGAAEQNEVARWLQRATVVALTSDNEGMPVCLMEAASCGVPVVATRVGGIPELVDDAVTGLLSPPGDVDTFASALERILSDDELRERMRGAARRRAVKEFSVAQQVDELMELWAEVLSGELKPLTPVLSQSDSEKEKLPRVDPELPTLAAALDFETARHEFKRRLPRLSGESGKLRLKAIRVTRHKPGRRCVVEYDVTVRRPGAEDERVTLIGKLRARRSGNEGFRQLEAFWNAGFDARNADGISVPEPIGVIAAFHMWFQRKVSGVMAEEVFSKAAKADRVTLARRVAEAMRKVHRCGVPTEKQHAMADELRILRECLDTVAVLKPEWTERLAKLMTACDKLGASVQTSQLCGVHRDFYPAQVIVDGPPSPGFGATSARLWVIDFDLYCLGDPGLDAGNFIGHLTEQALRERGDADALADVERALEERFVELAGERVRASLRAYTTLTLARHIFLSTKFPERAHLTGRLLELCERRLL